MSAQFGGMGAAGTAISGMARKGLLKPISQIVYLL
jgi:hypothetical protein